MTTLNNLKLLLPLAPDCERSRIISQIEKLEAKRKTMTIYEIKQLTARTSPHFFTRASLAFFGQTMRDFKVEKCADGRYKISAPMRSAMEGWPRIVGETIRYFYPATNTLERE